MKKLLALLLAAIMLVATPVAAYAADGDGGEDKDLLTTISELFENVNNALDFSRTDASAAKVTLSTEKYPYNGKIKHPVATVTLGDTELRKGMDYKVVYDKDCKSVGTHNVTITFIGTYEGEDIVVPFEIYKVDVNAASIKSLSASGKVITVNINTASDVDGYQIQYCKDKDYAGTIGTVYTTKATRKFKAKFDSRKYYVRIRSYKLVDGKKFFSDWSKVKTIKTTK